ncbi:MAG: hypothetical protein QXF52_10590 [Thermoproteota archaeon]
MPGLFEIIFEIVTLLSLGIVLKKTRVINEPIGRRLLSLSLNLLLPIMVFHSFATVRISLEDSLLPLIGLMLNLSLLAIAYLVSKNLNMNNARRGAFLLGCSTLNIGIIGLPFIELFFKAEGVATASLLDIGNSLYVFSIAFLVASRFNPSKREDSFKNGIKRFLTQPYILSIAIGLVANISKMELPEPVAVFTSIVSFINIVIILIAVGVFIKLPAKSLMREIVASATIKVLLGGLVGLIFASLFSLAPQALKVTLIIASLPPAFMTLIHASTENLDLEFATILLGSMLAIGIPVIVFYGLLFSV